MLLERMKGDGYFVKTRAEHGCSSDHYLMAQYSAAHKRKTAETREIPLRQPMK